MKPLFLMLASQLPLTASAMQWPGADGTYCETGTFTKLNDGSQTNYVATTTISSTNSTLATSYTYPSGFHYTLSYTMVETGNGLFDILVVDAVVGSGFCLGHTCNSEIDYTHSYLGPIKVSLSAVFENDSIVTTGRNHTSNTIFQSSGSLCE